MRPLLRAEQLERDGGTGLVALLENSGGGGRAIHYGKMEQAELVNQTGFEQGPVEVAAAFEEQGFDGKEATQLVEHQREVELFFATEKVGNALFAQVSQVFVAHLLGEDADEVVVVDVAGLPAQLAVGVHGDGEGIGGVVGHEILTVERVADGLQVRGQAFGEVLFHGHAAAHPGIGRESGGGGFVLFDIGRIAPAAENGAPVERAHHVANNAGF